ncbi:MAG: YkgJ family cysteine cluster protein [Thermodesulfobacteriota bacterium]
MSEPDRIALSPEEAIAAICFDFNLYPPQTRLFLDLCPMILGENVTVMQDHRQDKLWISVAGRRQKYRMAPVTGRELATLLCRRLEQTRPAGTFLSDICSRVFQAPAYPQNSDSEASDTGVWIETGMDRFNCRQCGQCCRQLDYHDQVTESDYRMWQRLARRDILDWVGVTRRNGKVYSYSIWMEPGTRRYAPVCPWLKKAADGSHWICQIHDVKPEICRQYPYTRKHGLMTGCSGFDPIQQSVLLSG